MLNLNKEQKNKIFRIIEQTGLNPSRFTWIVRIKKSFVGHLTGYEKGSVEALVIQHEGQEFSFTFETGESSYFSHVVPQITSGENIVFSESWGSLLIGFQDWLNVIKYELEELDLWKELPRGQALMAIPSDYSWDGKFSTEERRLLAEQLSKIQKFIIDSNRLSGSIRIQVQQTFIYLQQRAETATKLDWKNLFAGAILSLLLDKAVSNAPEIMKLCNELLSPFFQKLLQ